MPPVSAPRTLPSMPKVSVCKTPMHRQANMPDRPLLLDEGTFIVAEQLVRLVSHAGRALKAGGDLRAHRLRNESVALGARRTRRVRALVQCASRRDVAEARMATATVIGSVLSGIGSALSGTRGACRQDVR